MIESGSCVSVSSAGRTVRPTWAEIDQQLRAIAARRAALDLDEARWLVVARRTGMHRHLGFARLEEYVERVMGHGAHAATERLRVAEALVELPATRAAFDAGELHYTAVRELTRVMVPDTEATWLAAARGRTLREIEPMVTGRTKGDLPDTPVAPGDRRHRVRFELSGETFALLREARLAIADASGASLDDDEFIAALCRAVLDGGTAAEPSRARHQIAITTCDSCERGWQDGGGCAIEIAPAAIERARCDAQHVGRLDATAPSRSHQDVTPAVRALVWRRDHGACVVPGCRSARFLDVHHIVYRSGGGDHTADNLCVLCSAHHDRVHDGTLVIRGPVSSGLTFSHADGRRFGEPPRVPSPTWERVGTAATRDTTVHDDAVSAIHQTGFPLKQARAAVAAVLSHVGADATLDAVVRAGFQHLHQTSGPAEPLCDMWTAAGHPVRRGAAVQAAEGTRGHRRPRSGVSASGVISTAPAHTIGVGAHRDPHGM
jgi:hypothetical protein